VHRVTGQGATARARPGNAGARPGYRERLIDAMAQSVEEKGYRETIVSDIVRIARTSRTAFYDHFEDREACFLALFDAANDAVIEKTARAARPDRPWFEQVDDAVGAYLDAMEERPLLWRSFLRELPALGEAGAARQREVIERFAEMLVNLVEAGLRQQPREGATSLTKEMGTVIAGGLTVLVIVAADQGRDIRELKPVAAKAVKAILSETVLNPYT
jgi:AcrR family transcriptional regulator